MPTKIDILSLEDLKNHCTIDDKGCWIWNHSVRGQRGYAQITGRVAGRKQMGGHVLSFWLSRGYFPKLAMHTCHVYRCCNPDHIVDGTYSENNQQCWDVGGKSKMREEYRKRMTEDKSGIYAAGRQKGLARGLVKMNGVDVLIEEYEDADV